MAKIKLFLASILVCTSAFAQQTAKIENTDEVRKCGQSEALERMQLEDPVRYQMYQQSRAILEQESQLPVQRAGTIYTIPVVFHVLHNNGSENITDAQIQDALNILNRDYRKLNTDVNSVYSTFLPITGDAEIEFAFAKIAPNGACFNGITRTVSNLTNNGSDGQAQVNAIIAGNNVYQGVWPHNKYLNVYICKEIGGAAGYTYLPNGNSTANSTNMYYNGVFILHSYLGSIGTSSVGTSRALTHEVGHWLNLQHIWGSGNNPGVACGDDGITDTPNTKGFTSCPSSNSAKICNASVVENYENYMDYSYCSKMFTQGQAAWMRTAIISSVGGRSNIWTTTNLQNVGVLANPSSLCSAELQATPTALCQGTSTSFAVTNVSAPITSYSWVFTGGTPATSTQATPTVTYNTPGNYTVTVTITTATSNRTITNTSYITVAASSTTVALPITEGFVGTTFPPTAWTRDNGGNATTWNRNGTKGTAPTAGNSANLNFDPGANTTGNIDDLNTPAFSLGAFTSASATFDVAYRPYDATYFDKLEVLVSPGCGMAYQVVYSKAGATLQTEAASTSAYTNPTTWRNETIDLTPYLGSSEVKVKFRGVSGYGSQIYIDNVNISGVTGGTPTAAFTASSNSVCQGQTVTYTNTSTGASSFSWNFGAGATPATATGAGPHSVVYSSSGSKTVTLSVNGGASTSNITVTVNALPTVTFGALPSLCANDSPITLNQGSPSGGTYSGSGVSGNQFNPASTTSGTKTITYSYTSSPTGCSNSATSQIVIKALPTVALANLPIVCVYNAPITLTQGSPAGGTYSGVGVSGNQFDPSIGVGLKTITYTFTSSSTGCTNSANKQITVDGCLGVDSEDPNSFKLFPNPTSGVITISSSFLINEIVVIDNVGRVVMVLNPKNSNSVNMDLSNLSTGSYLIQTKMGSVTKMSKVVVE